MMRLTTAAAILFIAGCATSFNVGELKTCKFAEPGCGLDTPDGLVVNKRATYKATLDTSQLKQQSPDPAVFTGVDQDRLTVVNMCRQPFAGGTLEVTLDSQQRIKKLAITSTPGTAAALDAATESLAAKQAFDKKAADSKDKSGEKDQ